MSVKEVRVCDRCGKVPERVFYVNHDGLTIHHTIDKESSIKEGDYCDSCFANACGIKTYTTRDIEDIFGMGKDKGIAPPIKWPPSRDGGTVLLNEYGNDVPVERNLANGNLNTVRGGVSCERKG